MYLISMVTLSKRQRWKKKILGMSITFLLFIKYLLFHFEVTLFNIWAVQPITEQLHLLSYSRKWICYNSAHLNVAYCFSVAHSIRSAAFLELDLLTAPSMCDFSFPLSLSLYNPASSLVTCDKYFPFLVGFLFVFKIVQCKNSRNILRWSR